MRDAKSPYCEPLSGATASSLGSEKSPKKKKEKEEIASENKSLLESMTAALNNKVKEVRLSSRLKTHPVCLISDDGLSMEMEKVLSVMPNENKIKAKAIMEINASHPIAEKLKELKGEKKEYLKFKLSWVTGHMDIQILKRV